MFVFLQNLVGKFLAEIVWEHALRDLLVATVADTVRRIAVRVLDELGLRASLPA